MRLRSSTAIITAEPMVMHDGSADLKSARVHCMFLGDQKQFTAVLFIRRNTFMIFNRFYRIFGAAAYLIRRRASSQPRRAVMTPNGILMPRCLV